MSPALIFDLDGTLVDTAPDLVESLNHALASAGVEPAERDAIGFHVGMGGRAMIERAYALRSRQLSPEELERLAAVFLAHYADRIPGGSQPYPGVVEAIEAHRADGFIVGICTNKPEALALRLIEALGLSQHFSAICGADTFPFRKPDPRHLLETLARAGGVANQTLMMGDSRTDINTAKAAGIPVVAVDFGYTDRPVAEYEPTLVISDYRTLTPALSRRLIAAAQG